MDIAYSWHGGDQLLIRIENDGDVTAEEVRLRLDFGNGDLAPSEVLSGIVGYDDHGTALTPDPPSLPPRMMAQVLLRVPRQRTERIHVTWDDSGNEGHATCEVEGG